MLIKHFCTISAEIISTIKSSNTSNLSQRNVMGFVITNSHKYYTVCMDGLLSDGKNMGNQMLYVALK